MGVNEGTQQTTNSRKGFTMRRKGIWMAALAMATFAGSASATPINTDGDWSDWFSLNLQGAESLTHSIWYSNRVVLTNPNIRTQVDEEGPTPGRGGQPYDVEQIFYYYDDFDDTLSGGTLHIGLVTGFPSGGDPSEGIYAGDLFLDFGNTGSFTHAIAVGTENTAENDFGARFGRAWGNTGAPSWTTESVIFTTPPNDFTASNPYRVNEDEPGAVLLGGVLVNWGGVGAHYFLEVTIAIDGAQEEVLTSEFGGIGIHWTMQCGNDEIDVFDNTPFAPVPEPATLMLLGMGVLGIALRSRKPNC
jgi:hypothetical protein